MRALADHQDHTKLIQRIKSNFKYRKAACRNASRRTNESNNNTFNAVHSATSASTLMSTEHAEIADLWIHPTGCVSATAVSLSSASVELIQPRHSVVQKGDFNLEGFSMPDLVEGHTTHAFNEEAKQSVLTPPQTLEIEELVDVVDFKLHILDNTTRDNFSLGLVSATPCEMPGNEESTEGREQTESSGSKVQIIGQLPVDLDGNMAESNFLSRPFSNCESSTFFTVRFPC